jgi:hypothetical protein
VKAYGGAAVLALVFLTSALVGGEWSASRPGRFTPGKRGPSTQCIGGCVGPRTGLDDLEKWKFLTLLGLELGLLIHPAHSLSLYWLCYPSSLRAEVKTINIHTALSPCYSSKVLISRSVCIYVHCSLYCIPGNLQVSGTK